MDEVRCNALREESAATCEKCRRFSGFGEDENLNRLSCGAVNGRFHLIETNRAAIMGSDSGQNLSI